MAGKKIKSVSENSDGTGVVVFEDADGNEEIAHVVPENGPKPLPEVAPFKLRLKDEDRKS